MAKKDPPVLPPGQIAIPIKKGENFAIIKKCGWSRVKGKVLGLKINKVNIPIPGSRKPKKND